MLVQLLDLVADDQRNQLSAVEISLLGLSVVAAAISPVLFPDTPRLVEVMAPATAACKFQPINNIYYIWIDDSKIYLTY